MSNADSVRCAPIRSRPSPQNERASMTCINGRAVGGPGSSRILPIERPVPVFHSDGGRPNGCAHQGDLARVEPPRDMDRRADPGWPDRSVASASSGRRRPRRRHHWRRHDACLVQSNPKYTDTTAARIAAAGNSHSAIRRPVRSRCRKRLRPLGQKRPWCFTRASYGACIAGAPL
jgi:hypothetical protein